MAQANLPVITVMGGCDFNGAGTLSRVGVNVIDNRNFNIGQRNHRGLANQVFQFLVFGMNRNRLIPEQCFRTRCCDFNKSAVRQRVIEVIKLSFFVAGFNLQIRNGRLLFRAPVHQPARAINQTFVIHFHKQFCNRTRQPRVHCKAFTMPDRRHPQRVQLFHNLAALVRLPCPGDFQ